MSKLGTALSFLCMVCCADYALAEQDYVYTDIAVKALYIINIVNFIDSPIDKDKSNICIIGDDLIGVSISQLQQSKDSRYDGITVLKSTENSNLSQCRLVYISSKLIDRYNMISFRAKNAGVLSVSDIEGFSQKSGMIELITMNNKIRMNINIDNVEEAGIKLSSRLIEIANKVIRHADKK